MEVRLEVARGSTGSCARSGSTEVARGSAEGCAKVAAEGCAEGCASGSTDSTSSSKRHMLKKWSTIYIIYIQIEAKIMYNVLKKILGNIRKWVVALLGHELRYI